MEETKGNPEIGMQGDSLEEAGSVQEATDSGSSAFFNDLENQVNGGIVDAEATQSQSSGPEQVTHANYDNGSNRVAEQSNDGTDWQKRYTDSSREAVKWRDQYKQVEQFVPVLNAMKKDSGLVEHVRNYFKEGGAPAKSLQEKLGLDEDFVFDQQEAMTDPESDSAKLMNAHVDTLVSQRVGQIAQSERQRSMQMYQAQKLQKDEIDFKAKHGMTDEQYAAFKEQASKHTMTLDDVHYLLNKNQTAQNVATNTKQEMLSQMKNVRNMPTSASGANSQGGITSEDRGVFDSILGNDNSVDNLFG
tara:strand:+ start:3054 stop:3962 length:909 start_codon:yes stop_codon:yes gene_type:complete